MFPGSEAIHQLRDDPAQDKQPQQGRSRHRRQDQLEHPLGQVFGAASISPSTRPTRSKLATLRQGRAGMCASTQPERTATR